MRDALTAGSTQLVQQVTSSALDACSASVDGLQQVSSHTGSTCSGVLLPGSRCAECTTVLLYLRGFHAAPASTQQAAIQLPDDENGDGEPQQEASVMNLMAERRRFMAQAHYEFFNDYGDLQN